MQPSEARDRVRGAANIAGDERRASGVTGPSAESIQNMSPLQPIAERLSLPNQIAPLEESTTLS